VSQRKRYDGDGDGDRDPIIRRRKKSIVDHQEKKLKLIMRNPNERLGACPAHRPLVNAAGRYVLVAERRRLEEEYLWTGLFSTQSTLADLEA